VYYPFTGTVKVWFVMDCGGEIGNAAKYNRRLCGQKGLAHMGTAQIVMPENCIAMFNARRWYYCWVYLFSQHPSRSKFALNKLTFLCLPLILDRKVRDCAGSGSASAWTWRDTLKGLLHRRAPLPRCVVQREHDGLFCPGGGSARSPSVQLFFPPAPAGDRGTWRMLPVRLGPMVS